jgi:hypothetical protein
MNLKIVPSKRKNKKIDVYKDNNYVISIGDIRYSDYPTYILTKGKAYADKRRELYYERHNKDKGIAGEYAKKLLW